MRRKTVLVLIVLTVLVVSGGVLIYLAQRPSVNGLLISPRTPAPDFTLTADNQQAISLHDYRGKIVLVYFGYTFCPDVCPGTLAAVKLALKELGPQAADVQLLMITVDPARDNPVKLRQYLNHFNKSFIGLVGSPEETARTAAAYGAKYRQHPGTAATGYLVDHTAEVYVIDRDGDLALRIPYGMRAQEIAADLRYVLNQTDVAGEAAMR